MTYWTIQKVERLDIDGKLYTEAQARILIEEALGVIIDSWGLGFAKYRESLIRELLRSLPDLSIIADNVNTLDEITTPGND